MAILRRFDPPLQWTVVTLLMLALVTSTLSNHGTNFLHKVISTMEMSSHSTTGLATKFGKLLLEDKKIGPTMIVTEF
ncbi:hypothetical protein AAZX31_01G050800 [Glycine max]